MYNTGSTSLKHRKRRNFYTNSTGTCTFDPKTEEAYSYGWWCFVQRIKGKLVFNDYSYSSSTSGHQSAVRGLLRMLKLKVDVTVHVQAGLGKLKTDALKPVYTELFELELFGHRTKTVRKHNPKTYESKRVPYTEAMLDKDVEAVRKRIKVLRELGAVFTREQQRDLKASMLKEDTERRESNRKEAAERRALKRAKADALKSLAPVNLLETELDSTEAIRF